MQCGAGVSQGFVRRPVAALAKIGVLSAVNTSLNFKPTTQTSSSMREWTTRPEVCSVCTPPRVRTLNVINASWPPNKGSAQMRRTPPKLMSSTLASTNMGGVGRLTVTRARNGRRANCRLSRDVAMAPFPNEPAEPRRALWLPADARHNRARRTTQPFLLQFLV
jgi:hypothetical protein